MHWYETYLIKQALHGPWNVRPAGQRMKRQGTMDQGSQRGPNQGSESKGSKPMGYPQTGSVSGGTGGATYA